jgi:hypothetical protein
MLAWPVIGIVLFSACLYVIYRVVDLIIDVRDYFCKLPEMECDEHAAVIIISLPETKEEEK